MSDMETELRIYRDNVRRFVKEQVAPFYEAWERQEIMPRDLWYRMAEAGMLCCDIPEEYGGVGAGYRFSVVVQEEVARAGFLALASGLAVHSDIVAHYILNAGTEEQKQHYLPRMARGEYVGAIAMTEPGAGSDLQSIRASARVDGEGWRVNGSKTFITNGQNADFVITAVKTDPQAPGSKGMSLLLVDAGSPGFEKGRNLEKIGQHAADTSELFYTDVYAGPEKLLGPLNRGFIVLMNELPRERLTLSVGAVAHARGALDITVAYVKERKAFGQPLAAMQNTRFSLATMASDITVHEMFLQACIERLMRKELDTATASMAKLNCCELEDRVVDACLQLFGGYGYMREYPISRFYVDSRIQRIYGGASEVMKEIISRGVLA